MSLPHLPTINLIGSFVNLAQFHISVFRLSPSSIHSKSLHKWIKTKEEKRKDKEGEEEEEEEE
jgi:hypothetical protein